MFKSVYFPNGWNGDNRFIGYLDKKDFEKVKVKDLQNNLSGSKFIPFDVQPGQVLTTARTSGPIW